MKSDLPWAGWASSISRSCRPLSSCRLQEAVLGAALWHARGVCELCHLQQPCSDLELYLYTMIQGTGDASGTSPSALSHLGGSCQHRLLQPCELSAKPCCCQKVKEVLYVFGNE